MLYAGVGRRCRTTVFFWLMIYDVCLLCLYDLILMNDLRLDAFYSTTKCFVVFVFMFAVKMSRRCLECSAAGREAAELDG